MFTLSRVLGIDFITRYHTAVILLSENVSVVWISIEIIKHTLHFRTEWCVVRERRGQTRQSTDKIDLAACNAP